MADANEDLLREVLARVKQNNLEVRPGTPMADLKTAIESSLSELPQLNFEEFTKALDNKDAANELVRRAPDLAGWNADQIVEWVEILAKRMNA